MAEGDRMGHWDGGRWVGRADTAGMSYHEKRQKGIPCYGYPFYDEWEKHYTCFKDCVDTMSREQRGFDSWLHLHVNKKMIWNRFFLHLSEQLVTDVDKKVIFSARNMFDKIVESNKYLGGHYAVFIDCTFDDIEDDDQLIWKTFALCLSQFMTV